MSDCSNASSNDIQIIHIPEDKMQLVQDLATLSDAQMKFLDKFIQLLKNKNTEQN